MPEDVRVAVRKAVKWLDKTQRRDGSWGRLRGTGAYGPRGRLHDPKHGGGLTALAVYALLSAGVPEKDPMIRKGFDYLKRLKKPDNALHASALLLAITQVAQPFRTKQRDRSSAPRVKIKGKYRGWAVKLVDHLVDRRSAQGWRYDVPEVAPPGGPQDLFSTHLAALALLQAHGVGIKVKRKVWEDALAFARAQQVASVPSVELEMDDGTTKRAYPRGFAYIQAQDETSESRTTTSMTACGASTIGMARLVLTDWGEDLHLWQRREDATAVETSHRDGLVWLVVNSPLTDQHDDPERVSHLCRIWSFQCAMDASAVVIRSGTPA